MNLINYLVNNLSLILFAYTVTYNKEDFVHARILKTYIVYVTNIILMNLMLGLIIQQLSLPAIQLVCIIQLIIALVMFKRKNLTIKLHYKDLVSKFFESRLFVVLGGILAAVVALLAYISLFTTPYSYDSTAYHLPTIVDYIQNKRIFITDKLVWSNCYPKNMEMLFMWDLIHFRNGATLNFQQILCEIMGAMAVGGILKENKVKNHYSLLGAILYLSTPIVLAQMTTQYIDAALSSFFIIALLFLIRFINHNMKADRAIFAIALGILLGIKASSIAYVTVFIFATFVALIYKKNTLKTTILNISIISIICLAVGSVWYVINIIYFKNPIYPFGIRILGMDIISGVNIQQQIMDSNTPKEIQGKFGITQILLSWSELLGGSLGEFRKYFSGFNAYMLERIFVIYDERLGGFGFQWMWFLLPATLVALVKKVKHKRIKLVDILVIGIPTICLLSTPSNWWTRYTCFILMVGIYGTITLLDSESFRPSIRKFLHMAIRVFVAISILQGISFFITLTCFNLAQSKHMDRYLQLPFIQSINSPGYRDFYKEINLKKLGASITVFSPLPDSIIYYFEGYNTQNRVYYYPANKSNKITIPDMSRPLEQIQHEFGQLVRKNKSDYIIVSKNFTQFVNVEGYKKYMVIYSNVLYKKV